MSDTARDALERWIASQLPRFNLDELKTIAVRVERLGRAQPDYGILDLAEDRRDWRLEAAYEGVDRVWYEDAKYVFDHDPVFADIREMRRREAEVHKRFDFDLDEEPTTQFDTLAPRGAGGIGGDNTPDATLITYANGAQAPARLEGAALLGESDSAAESSAAGSCSSPGFAQSDNRHATPPAVAQEAGNFSTSVAESIRSGNGAVDCAFEIPNQLAGANPAAGQPLPYCVCTECAMNRRWWR